MVTYYDLEKENIKKDINYYYCMSGFVICMSLILHLIM
jgi:hypothetical protein